jgi:hypothetical protein
MTEGRGRRTPESLATSASRSASSGQALPRDIILCFTRTYVGCIGFSCLFCVFFRSLRPCFPVFFGFLRLNSRSPRPPCLCGGICVKQSQLATAPGLPPPDSALPVGQQIALRPRMSNKANSQDQPVHGAAHLVLAFLASWRENRVWLWLDGFGCPGRARVLKTLALGGRVGYNHAGRSR